MAIENLRCHITKCPCFACHITRI
uniref:Uncharacterized protein n=1 Tax=Arundo donax TaxID=35708 RepID=A0A0A9G3E7_ARUDO